MICTRFSIYLTIFIQFFIQIKCQKQLIVHDVIDGDTIKAIEHVGSKTLIKIRLSCIDAPEISQSWGEKSRNKLSKLLPVGSKVTVLSTSKDRYQRVLAELINEDDVNVNLEMIRLGYAMTYYLKQNAQCKKSESIYLEKENYAKKKESNIWSDPTFVPPWQYRKDKKQNNNKKTLKEDLHDEHDEDGSHLTFDFSSFLYICCICFTFLLSVLYNRYHIF